jgi:hypothetical protein
VSRRHRRDSVLRYCNGTWTVATPPTCPPAVLMSCTAVLDDDVYFVGHVAWRYRVSTDEWTQCAPPTYVHSYFAVAGANDGIKAVYACAGALCEWYCPGTDRWHPMATMHVAHLSGAAAAFVDGRLFVCGGDRDGIRGQQAITVSQVESYNPRTDAWTIVAPMPLPRVGATALVTTEA